MPANTEEFNQDVFGGSGSGAPPPSPLNAIAGTSVATWTAGGIGGGTW